MKALSLAVLLLAVDPVTDRNVAEFVEMPGLALRGTGCHRQLVTKAGVVVCEAFVKAVRPCYPALIARAEPDGGAFAERVLLGARCPAPRLNSGAIGGATFFVGEGDAGLLAWCDDDEDRGPFEADVLACCASLPKLKNRPACVPRSDVGPSEP